MPSKRSSFVLDVVGAADSGARFELDHKVRTIGRSVEADFVLHDLSISRRHIQVAVTSTGVQFEVCGGAAPFLLEGRPLRSVEAKDGDRILVGRTMLVVTSVALDSLAPSSSRAARGPTDIRTLLTGAGADAQAMAALHGLIGAFDSVHDLCTLEGALRVWSSEYVTSCTVEIRRSPDVQTSSSVLEPEDGGATVIVVPAPADDPVSLAFRCTVPVEKVTDSLHRMLILAGRLFGSSLERIRRQGVAEGEVAALRALSFGSARGFLGRSPGAQELAAKIPRLAASEVSVLIEGETGVGKTFLARLIHEASSRAREALRVINCAAIPESLLESELFGHERGAFTGATARRIGALEGVGRGTLLLDEIGELSPAGQAKLLHVLEERKFVRIGSNQALDLRARVLCATNRDLEAMAAAGQFRRDLLFRIAVVRVRVPSLRERTDDLPQLASHILADAAQSAGRRVTGFTSKALELIRSYAWPGNVRELRNAVEHAVALGEGALVDACDLPIQLASVASQPDDRDLVRLPLDMLTLERRAIEAALRATNGHRERAAQLVGIKRTTFFTKLKEYGL